MYRRPPRGSAQSAVRLIQPADSKLDGTRRLGAGALATAFSGPCAARERSAKPAPVPAAEPGPAGDHAPSAEPFA